MSNSQTGNRNTPPPQEPISHPAGQVAPGEGLNVLRVQKPSWIEIELVGMDEKPVPGVKYRITLPDGTFREGQLDENGSARVEGFHRGKCKVSFPDLDQDAWEDADAD